jgi:Zn-dependent protease with chaperone function
MKWKALALVTLAALLATPASAQLSRNYPARGKALDALRPADDYSSLTAQRPRSVAIMRARAHGYVPSPELHDYVKGVLTQLLAGVPLPASFTPDVRVLAAPDFNALCTPDGTIVVSIGLLGQIQSEDELAFILAHEVSHAILRHHGSDWFTKSQYYAIMHVSSLNQVATQVQAATAGQGVPGAGVNLANVQRGLDIATKIYALSENVLSPQFEQGQEDQADALAIDLMIKAGYSPAGAGAALERLAAAEAAAAAAAASAQQATSGNRGGGGLGALGALGGLAMGGLTGQGPSLSNLNTQQMMDIGIAALDVATATMARDVKPHRPATQRADMTAAYQFREYRDLVPGDLKRLAWGQTDARGQALVRLLTNYRAADAVGDYVVAVEGGRLGNVGTARSGADFAVREPTANHAYTQYPVSRLREIERRPADAQAARQAALRSPEPSWIAYRTDIDASIARRDFNAAQTTVTEAVARFEDSPILLPKRIAILHALGRDPEARQLVTQCTSYDVKELREQCENALAGR